MTNATATTRETSTSRGESRGAWRQDEKLWAIGLTVSVLMTLLVNSLSGYLDKFPHLPDRGAFWYYWVLAEPTMITRFTAWGLYSCHQLLHWAMVYYGQTNLKYSHQLRPFHYWMAAMNLAFLFIHLLKTHITYDGLAQDTHITTSMGSVVVMLIWVLLMENSRRGMFFGYPLPFSDDLIKFARKYHAYYFSWAILYNFWYHPMEGGLAHLSGFIYKFFLIVQSCLMMTPIHYNKYWTLVLEVMVLLHGSVVAYITMPGTGMWSVFFFGFVSMFVCTQIHGLGLSRKQRTLVTLVSVLPGVFIYSQRKLWQLNKPLRIPIIDYIGVLVLAAILWCVKKFFTQSKLH